MDAFVCDGHYDTYCCNLLGHFFSSALVGLHMTFLHLLLSFGS